MLIAIVALLLGLSGPQAGAPTSCPDRAFEGQGCGQEVGDRGDRGTPEAPVPAPPGEDSGPTRPGHGYGDENHDHTGPPGQGSERPGYGYGDDKHEHTGPPGRN